MMTIISRIRKDLKANVDAHTKSTGKRFFKESINLHGVKVGTVNKIADTYWKTIKDQGKKDIFKLCEELWSSGYIEETFIACRWTHKLKDHYTKSDFKVFERWISKYINNWASCDSLCNHPVGSFLEMYPDYVKHLKRWAKSKNRWMRRAAAVSLIWPARKGLFLREIIQIANILIKDDDDLVQKGYGWMLKAASEAHQQKVFDYLMTKRDGMPRTAFRYALEKMPERLRKKAMKK